jgi:hypothetical protein
MLNESLSAVADGRQAMSGCCPLIFEPDDDLDDE